MTSSRLALSVSLAALALASSTGCGSLSAPFDKMKGSQMTVYQLQNFEPPAQAQAAPQPATMGLPPQIQQWIQAGASLLPPGLLPPGLVSGAAPAPQPQTDAPRFHGFRILAWQPVGDASVKSDILDAFGHESNFTAAPPSCMYAEFGFALSQPNGTAPADVLVSLSCAQVQAHNFQWPYPAKTGVSPDTEKKMSAIVQKLFGSHG